MANEQFGRYGGQKGTLGPVGLSGRVEGVFDEWGPFEDLSTVGPVASGGVITNLSEMTILKSDLLWIPAQCVIKNITLWASLSPASTRTELVILFPKWRSSDRAFDYVELTPNQAASRNYEMSGSGTQVSGSYVGEVRPVWTPRKESDYIDFVIYGVTFAKADLIGVGALIEFTNVG